MINTPKLLKVFLDTSVLLSGLNSPSGASGFILSLFKLKRLIIVISPEVINEAEKVIKIKFPLLKIPLFDFLTIKPLITLKLASDEIRSTYKIMQSEDTPILAGAIKANADYLLTLDRKFQRLVKNKVGFEILLPGEFLQIYRKKYHN